MFLDFIYPSSKHICFEFYLHQLIQICDSCKSKCLKENCLFTINRDLKLKLLILKNEKIFLGRVQKISIKIDLKFTVVYDI